MATRKVKHQRALEKRERWLTTIHQGNQDFLKKEQTRRNEEKAQREKEARDRKIAKSKKLAERHRQSKNAQAISPVVKSIMKES